METDFITIELQRNTVLIFTNIKLHLLNQKARVSSDILVGHVTSSQNESGLSNTTKSRDSE